MLRQVRDIAAQEFSYKTGDIAKREKLPNSLMPPGLVISLTSTAPAAWR